MSASLTGPNEHDLEMLSAYLDGALNEHDRAILDQRLLVESDLRAELDSLRQTVNLLRRLPTLRAPRDFTLEPATYRPRAIWWQRILASPWTLQGISALGAAASVILIIGALLIGKPTQEDNAPSIALRSTAETTATALLPNTGQATSGWDSLSSATQEPTMDEAQFSDQDSEIEAGLLTESLTGEQFSAEEAPGSQAPAPFIQPSDALGAMQADAPALAVPLPAEGQALSTIQEHPSDNGIGAVTGEIAYTPDSQSQAIEKEAQTPTIQAAIIVTVMHTPSPEPTLSEPFPPQLQSSSSPEHREDRRWLALVGAFTLTISLLIGFVGWRRSRS